MRQLSTIVFIFAAIAALCPQAVAHRPIFSDSAGTNAETAVEVREPDISQVIYRSLDAEQELWLKISVETKKFICCEPFMEPKMFREETHAGPDIKISQWLSENPALPFGRRDQSKEHFDRGSFSGAIRSQKTEYLTALNREIEIANGNLLTKFF